MNDLTILIIDDNDDCNDLVEIVLKQDTNWRVLTALNGKDGIEIAKTRRPEVVLLDLAMPQMDGIEVYKILKSKLTNHLFVVIFFTAMPRISQKIKALTNKDIVIIDKPLDITTLADHITNVWNKAQGREFATLSK